ncbi:MAG: LysR family transcriptional regulator [Candidatus Limnocylindrales bacterium]|jgi:molybdate transport repressor ModE-like protein
MTGTKSGTPVEGSSPAGIRPAQRIWLHDQGMPVFGVGIRELLVRVEATGSLRHAASDMGMAYSKAWHIVRRAEEHLGFDLLERRIGGARGGGSGVSDEGRWLVGAFGAVLDEADKVLDELYEKHFGDWKGRSGDKRMDKAPQSMSSPRQD